MITEPLMLEAAFRRAALEASNVGTWEIDVEGDRFRCDAAAAAFYNLTPEESVAGVPIARTAALIHPDDLAMWRARRALSLRHGGVFVIEYRVLPPGVDPRWLLVRGRYDVGADGTVVEGRGIVIDVTESKRDGFAEGQASLIDAGGLGGDAALARAASHVLEAHKILSSRAKVAGPSLLAAADRLLEEVGLAIARTKPSPRDLATRH